MGLMVALDIFPKALSEFVLEWHFSWSSILQLFWLMLENLICLYALSLSLNLCIIAMLAFILGLTFSLTISLGCTFF